MTGDCHVRFCERLRGETPLCLLGVIYSLQFLNHNCGCTTAAVADAGYANVSALFVKYGAQGADYPGS